MIVANIEGLAGFTKRNKRSCGIFYARREKTCFCLVLPSSTKCEIRYFDVVVVQDS